MTKKQKINWYKKQSNSDLLYFYSREAYNGKTLLDEDMGILHDEILKRMSDSK